MDQQELIPHLFREEFRKIIAVISKRLGFEHIDAAEDIASETFLSALEIWPYKGLPENPVAWLYTVAKNKAKNKIARDLLFLQKIAPQIKYTTPQNEEIEIDLSYKNITDSQLQMLFALCHPSIPPEGQIGLSLRILCGFGIDEIANAFLTNKETIHKRLSRAKEKLRTEKVRIEFPIASEINSRLNNVLTTLYLLFSEGYYSEIKNCTLREGLCMEAIRLTHLLIENDQTNLPEVNALLSLMYFHSSRFPARKNDHGEIILYQDQDESLWDRELISKGAYYLHRSSRGNNVSKYHFEAGIAYWHTIKNDTKEKWENILQLYNHLLKIEYSSITALNRIYALARTIGKEEAIVEAEQLKLEDNHFYFALLGELYFDIDKRKAKENFLKAHLLARTQPDKKSIQKKIDMC